MNVKPAIVASCLITLILASGCSRIRSGNLKYDDILNETNWDWRVDHEPIEPTSTSSDGDSVEPTDSELTANGYVSEAKDTAAKQQEEDDLAKIVAVAEQEMELAKQPIKLVAKVNEDLLAPINEKLSLRAEPRVIESPMNSETADADMDMDTSVTDAQAPPKLAAITPLNLPSSTQSAKQSSSSNMFQPIQPKVSAAPAEIPNGVVSQPLTPLASQPSEPVPAGNQANIVVEKGAFESPEELVRMAALEANQMLDRESELDTEADKQPSCCETGTCGVDCPNFKREPEGNSFVADNNAPVVIVATTTESEFPPFAEAPLEDSPTLNQTEFESGQAELENPIIETPKVDAMAYQGNFSPISTPVATPSPMKSAAEVIASSQALVDFENWTDEDWNDVFGPVPGTPCQACEQGTCNSKGCLTAQPTGPKPTMHDYASTGMAAVDELVPDADIQPSPSDFEPNQFVRPIETTTEPSNEFVPASHTVDIPKSKSSTEVLPRTNLEFPNFVAPKSSNNFSPVTTAPEANAQPTDFAPIESTEPESSPSAETLFEVPPPAEVKIVKEVEVVKEIEYVDRVVPWTEKLDETIASMETRLSRESDAQTRNGLELNLRLLEMLKRQLNDAESSNTTFGDEEKAYWQHQLQAIDMMLNGRSDLTDLEKSQGTLQTLDQLRKAIQRLETIADLNLENGALCRSVTGYGQFEPFPSRGFGPTQKMLVYCEVENYLSRETTLGSESRFHTRLRGSYAIFNEQGRAVQQAEYPIVDDVVRNRRRDFYMYFPLQLNNFPSGNYRMKLMVEDLEGNKTATLEDIDFYVR